MCRSAPQFGATPLHVAARKGHTSVIAELLARGADVHATDQYVAKGARASDMNLTDLSQSLPAGVGAGGGGDAGGGGGAGAAGRKRPHTARAAAAGASPPHLARSLPGNTGSASARPASASAAASGVLGRPRAARPVRTESGGVVDDSRLPSVRGSAPGPAASASAASASAAPPAAGEPRTPAAAPPPKGFTALHHACKKGHTDAAELLLAKGANPHALNAVRVGGGLRKHHSTSILSVNSVFSVAITWPASTLITLALFSVPQANMSPLYCAAQSGALSTVELLLEYKADANCADTDGARTRDTHARPSLSL